MALCTAHVAEHEAGNPDCVIGNIYSIEDAGHGWLCVPRKMFVELGIEEKISSVYSSSRTKARIKREVPNDLNRHFSHHWMIWINDNISRFWNHGRGHN